MLGLRLLPWDYGMRNLFRRPTRTALTLAALTVVVLMVFVVVGFVRGLEASLANSGDRDVVLVYSVGSEGNIETSSIEANVPGLLVGSLSGIRRQRNLSCVSPELYLGTRVAAGEDESASMGLVRGVTTAAPLVRREVRITDGDWPGPGEVLVGRLAAAKLGYRTDDLAIGNSVTMEGRSWRISGHFAAGGSAFESELWCRLPDFQQATKRQDLSLVALLLDPGTKASQAQIFCKQRTDLELQAMAETAYYAVLTKHYGPVRMLAWLVVFLVAGAGVFAGLNLMYGAVTGRTRELATLQAIGFRRRAILLSLVQEGALLAATGSLIAAALAIVFLNNAAVRFTMGAFTLRVDAIALLVGCGTGLAVGVIGALPPALKALRANVVDSLKAV
jgi:ABC-type lipoprotein release transport system permease subunit